jgi:hypothetical protein
MKLKGTLFMVFLLLELSGDCRIGMSTWQNKTNWQEQYNRQFAEFVKEK